MSKNGSYLYHFLATFFLLLVVNSKQVEAINCIYTTMPEQVHIALRGNTGMTISWATPGYSRDTDTPVAKVLYGIDQNNLNKESTNGFSSSYYIQIGFRMFFHNVHLEDLVPGTKYYYRIASSGRCANASTIRWFTSPPTPGTNPNQAFQFTVIGDVSVNPIFDISHALATFSALVPFTVNSEFILFVGDLAYADFYIVLDPDYHDFERVWNDFGRRMDPIAAYKAVEVIPGNHEPTCNLNNGTACPEFLKHYSAYINRWVMSGELSGGYKNLWYSFDYGSAHIIMLNMETDFPDAPSGPGSLIDEMHAVNTSAQVTWFINDLKKANASAQRTKYPWLIVNGHRAFGGSEFVITGPPRPGKRATALSTLYCVSCRTAFMKYFEEYYVDFYFAGHVHWVEILYPMDANGNVVTQDFTAGLGTIHITQGSGGPPNGASPLAKIDEDRSYWFYGGFGFQNVKILNSTHATIDFIESRNSSILKVLNVVRRR